jgi:hypothetical protein
MDKDLYAVAGKFLFIFLLHPYNPYTSSDFCLIPIGTASVSVAEEVAECQRILAKSGLKYKVSIFTYIQPSLIIAMQMQ